jgi:hypothetical protein
MDDEWRQRSPGKSGQGNFQAVGMLPVGWKNSIRTVTKRSGGFASCTGRLGHPFVKSKKN